METPDIFTQIHAATTQGRQALSDLRESAAVHVAEGEGREADLEPQELYSLYDATVLHKTIAEAWHSGYGAHVYVPFERIDQATELLQEADALQAQQLEIQGQRFHRGLLGVIRTRGINRQRWNKLHEMSNLHETKEVGNPYTQMLWYEVSNDSGPGVDTGWATLSYVRGWMRFKDERAATKRGPGAELRATVRDNGTALFDSIRELACVDCGSHTPGCCDACAY